MKESEAIRSALGLDHVERSNHGKTIQLYKGDMVVTISVEPRDGPGLGPRLMLTTEPLKT